jgi:ADP-heptose:LPS heptosyltransferase
MDMQNWNNCKNILCIRADNMGDLIMTAPAIRALKESFACKITVLTSSAGELISPYLNEIDEVLVYDLPWIKTNKPVTEKNFFDVINEIKSHHFDAAVIFTVYSQNPLPAAMLAFMAGIPKRLAYCRENPYHLLTEWVPDKEPYSIIYHQVQRDLNLVASIGAYTQNDHLCLQFREDAGRSALKNLSEVGVDLKKEWIIMHPCVSEKKREYPVELWIEVGKLIKRHLHSQIILTGSASEKNLTDQIQQDIGNDAFSIAGLLSIEEFIALIHQSPLVISVNTGTVHIAAATQTPLIVLYALTNPQHTPWKVPCKVLPFAVAEELKSKNQVVSFVSNELTKQRNSFPFPKDILNAAQQLLNEEIKHLATS